MTGTLWGGLGSEGEGPDRHDREDHHRVAEPHLPEGEERERQAEIAGIAEDQRREVGRPVQAGRRLRPS